MLSETLSVNIIELIKELVNRSDELNKKYFSQYILPAWDLFNEIHKDYKYTFETYDKSIYKIRPQCIDQEVNKIIREIIWDSIYTEDLRSELKAIIDHAPPRKVVEFDQFINAINSYFYFNFHVSDNEITFLTPRILNLKEINLKEIINNYDLLDVSGPRRYKNIPRIYLIGRLRNKVDHDKIEDIAVEINRNDIPQILSKLQRNYRDVADAYYNLKASLKT